MSTFISYPFKLQWEKGGHVRTCVKRRNGLNGTVLHCTSRLDAGGLDFILFRFVPYHIDGGALRTAAVRCGAVNGDEGGEESLYTLAVALTRDYSLHFWHMNDWQERWDAWQ